MNEEFVSKIKKLFAMAQSTEFEEEAASFIGKANALMLQYKVTHADIDAHSDDPINIFYNSPLNEEDANKGALARWKAVLSLYITQENGCYAFYRGSNIILVGKPDNVANCRYIYEYCVSAVDNLAKNNCRGQGRTYTNNFRLGCVDAIRESMVLERKAYLETLSAAVAERALLVLNKVAQEHKESSDFANSKLNLRTKASHRSKYDGEARRHGRKAGESVYKGKQKYVQ